MSAEIDDIEQSAADAMSESESATESTPPKAGGPEMLWFIVHTYSGFEPARC